MSWNERTKQFKGHKSSLWEDIKSFGGQIWDAFTSLPSEAAATVENWIAEKERNGEKPSEPELRDYISELSKKKGQSNAGAGEEPEGLGDPDPNAHSALSPSLQPSLQDAELNTGTPREGRRVEESFALTDTDPVGLSEPIREDIGMISGERMSTTENPEQDFESTWESLQEGIGKLPKQDQDVLSYVHEFISTGQIDQAKSVAGRLDGEPLEVAKKLMKAAGL